MAIGPDSGFDIDDPAYNADARRATPPAPKVNFRITPPRPQLASAAPRHPHNMPLSTSPRSTPYVTPVVSQTPVVPKTTLSGIPLPSCIAGNTPAAIVETTANAATDTLKKPSVTEADMKALAIGDTVVSNNGTTREVTAIDGENFTFLTTKKITGATLTYFATKPADGEEKGDRVNFANMKQSDHVYNGGIDYTIRSILKTSEGVVTEVVLSHTETKENYRAQGYDHILQINKKKIFQKVIGVVPPTGPINGTPPIE